MNLRAFRLHHSLLPYPNIPTPFPPSLPLIVTPAPTRTAIRFKLPFAPLLLVFPHTANHRQQLIDATHSLLDGASRPCLVLAYPNAWASGPTWTAEKLPVPEISADPSKSRPPSINLPGPAAGVTFYFQRQMVATHSRQWKQLRTRYS